MGAVVHGAVMSVVVRVFWRAYASISAGGTCGGGLAVLDLRSHAVCIVSFRTLERPVLTSPF